MPRVIERLFFPLLSIQGQAELMDPETTSRFRIVLFFFFNIPQAVSFSFFLAVLGLCCCVLAFPSPDGLGLLFLAMGRLLIAVASLVSERGLQGARASVVMATGSAAAACGPKSVRFVAPQHVESSQTRDRTRVPCISRQILIHYPLCQQESPRIALGVNNLVIFPCHILVHISICQQR